MTPNARSHYRADIDGLRAVAVVLVIGYHLGLPGFSGGFIGVDVFFVISGYLIVGILERERQAKGRVSWPAFFARRARRLVPAMVLMLTSTLTLALLVLDPATARKLALSAIAAATSTANIWFAFVRPFNYFSEPTDATGYLHTWSLSVEEQFYLLLPVAFLAAAGWARLTRRDARSALVHVGTVLSLGSLGLAVLAAKITEHVGFFATTGRGYEFGAGALLAARGRLGSRATATAVGFVSLAVVAGASIVALPKAGFPGAWALIPALATAALLWSGTDRAGRFTPLGKLLASSGPVTIGRLSYSWYLWHLPLLFITERWYLGDIGMRGRLLVAAASLAVAALSYRFVETRFHPWPSAEAEPRPVRRSPWVAITAGATALALAAGFAGGTAVVAGRVDSSPHWTAVHRQLSGYFPLPSACLLMPPEPAELGTKPCPLTAFSPARPTVVVLGDSQARMYLGSVVAAAHDQDVNVVSWAQSGCAPYLTRGVPKAPTPGDLVSTCNQHNALAVDWITRQAKTAPVRVILIGRWARFFHEPGPPTPPPTPQAAEIIRRLGVLVEGRTVPLVRRLRTAGIVADVVMPTPEMARYTPLCLAQRFRTYSCSVTRAAAQAHARPARRWLTARVLPQLPQGARHIDATNTFCDRRTCHAERHGVAMYIDDSHLSKAGSLRAAALFVPSIRLLADAG